MSLFSHRHRTGRRHNCISYLLTKAKDDSPNIHRTQALKAPPAATKWARPLLLHVVCSDRIPFIHTRGCRQR